MIINNSNMKQTSRAQPSDKIFIPKSKLPNCEHSSNRPCPQRLDKAESVTLRRSNNWFTNQSTQQGNCTPHSNANSVASQKIEKFHNIRSNQKEDKAKSRKYSLNNMENKLHENNIKNNEYISNSALKSSVINENTQNNINRSNCATGIQNSNINTDHISSSWLPIQLMCLCPQLYQSYRIQQLLHQQQHHTFSLRTFSKGRKQILYADGTIQVYISQQQKHRQQQRQQQQMHDDGSEDKYKDNIVVTKWNSGDFKINNNKQGKVCYWNQALKQFDIYYTS